MEQKKHRLSFLIVETEPSQGLSTRKLLIESAKHNVITAYSAEEGLETFKRFPNVDAVVIEAELKGNIDLAKKVKQEQPQIRVVGLTSRVAGKEMWADESVNVHDPAELLKMLENR